MLRPPSSMHADATTPAETSRLSRRSLFRPVGGLPLVEGGSASASTRFEACSAFTRVPACMVAESPADLAPPLAVSAVSGFVPVWGVAYRPQSFPQSASTHVVTSMNRSGCYQRLATIAGWDSHPLGKRAFPRRTSTSRGLAQGSLRSRANASPNGATSESWRSPCSPDPGDTNAEEDTGYPSRVTVEPDVQGFAPVKPGRDSPHHHQILLSQSMCSPVRFGHERRCSR